LADNCDELGCAAEFVHDFPELIPTNCIKGLGQINEGREEVTMLFLPFLLELAGAKNRVSFSFTCAEAGLALRQETLLLVTEQTVKENTGQDPACYRQER